MLRSLTSISLFFVSTPLHLWTSDAFQVLQGFATHWPLEPHIHQVGGLSKRQLAEIRQLLRRLNLWQFADVQHIRLLPKSFKIGVALHVRKLQFVIVPPCMLGVRRSLSNEFWQPVGCCCIASASKISPAVQFALTRCVMDWEECANTFGWGKYGKMNRFSSTCNCSNVIWCCSIFGHGQRRRIQGHYHFGRCSVLHPVQTIPFLCQKADWPRCQRMLVDEARGRLAFLICEHDLHLTR